MDFDYVEISENSAYHRLNIIILFFSIIILNVIRRQLITFLDNYRDN